MAKQSPSERLMTRATRWDVVCLGMHTLGIICVILSAWDRGWLLVSLAPSLMGWCTGRLADILRGRANVLSKTGVGWALVEVGSKLRDSRPTKRS